MEVVPEKRKGAFEDCLEDDTLFTKFEKWLKRTGADQELLNQLYFYRDVFEWRASNENGFYTSGNTKLYVSYIQLPIGVKLLRASLRNICLQVLPTPSSG